MRDAFGLVVAGVEPSRAAASAAVDRDLPVKVGTADHLDYEAGSFDFVVFGFCLYLCDPADLFRISAEADRVLKADGWIILHDFFAKSHLRNPYHHVEGLMSHKMDYHTLFSWHPHYSCYSHQITHHQTSSLGDDEAEWVATSVMRKRSM